MNNTLIKIAEQYEKTAKILLQKAKQLRNGIDPNKCVSGEDTGERVNTDGCKTCGHQTWIKCKNKKVVANRVKSNYCKSCKQFSVSSYQLAVNSKK